jgi:spore coat protein A
MEDGITRREAIAAAGTVAAGAALVPYLRAVPAPAQSAAFTLPLRHPPILRKADIVLPIVQADVPLTRGERTLMWTFGGTFPGPTIRRAAGRTTRVTFEHRIPEAGTLTIHNHGHHNAAIHDGQPMSQLIEPGGRRQYVYEHVEDGAPLRGGMRWYHDHTHGQTNRNLWMGLMGLFIVVDPLEKELGLPQGDRELVLVLSTRTLDENNQLVNPFIGNNDPGADAVGSGSLLLVNGTARPYQVVEPTTYRLRILNAASFNPYNVGFETEKAPQLLQIGNESGLFPEPAKRSRVLMGPAERCDLFVDFSEHAGKRLVLGSAPQKATAPLASLLAPAVAPATEIVEFRVRRRKKKKTPGPRPAPKKLRALPSWTRGLSRTPDRLFVFGQAINPLGGQTTWTINGTPYDPARVIARPELGSTESWLLANVSTQSHYIHLHAVDWWVISRNGGTPAADEAVLKETFRLDPGETLAVGTKFTDHLGRFLIHCHMLSHEDHAMMTTFEIVGRGAGDRTARRSAAAAEALVRDERVLVPLGALTAEEGRRATRMLAGQQAGRAGTPPTAPLLLDPGAKLLCELEARA